MNNIFVEINIIKALIEKNNYILRNLLKYHCDILVMSNDSSIESKNIDTFLDFMPYSKYANLTSDSFKSIFHSFNQEIKLYKEKIKALNNELKIKLSRIYHLSKISKEELIYFYNYFSISYPIIDFDTIYLFNIFDNNIYINPILIDYLNIDSINCLYEYINQKYFDESLNLIDYLNCLKLDEEKVLN